MSSFSIPLSGLFAMSSALNIISNDLANLNTVGFKDQTANFQSYFYQNLGTDGSGNPIQQGMGAKVGSVATNFTDGNVQNTTVPSNVAITGNGFFVTQDSHNQIFYTRAGDFTVNAAGQLITPGGALVLGYPAVNGVVNTSAPVGPLQVGPGLTTPPNATTTMQQRTNLDANATAGTVFSTPLSVYDSLGNVHVLTFDYTETAANNWTYQITLPAADTGGAGAPTVVANGNLVFDSSGNLTTPAGSVAGINIAGLVDGAAPMSLTWNLTDANGASLMTQVAGKSATAATVQNGFPAGTLQSYVVDDDGVIEVTFSNNQTQALGQIALANFTNPGGLRNVGGNSYVASLASGAGVVGQPDTGGRGTLTGGALEMSNVDISTEFTRLIVTQRGFQANARMITTFDAVSNTTVNLQAQPGN